MKSAKQLARLALQLSTEFQKIAKYAITGADARVEAVAENNLQAALDHFPMVVRPILQKFHNAEIALMHEINNQGFTARSDAAGRNDSASTAKLLTRKLGKLKKKNP